MPPATSVVVTVYVSAVNVADTVTAYAGIANVYAPSASALMVVSVADESSVAWYVTVPTEYPVSGVGVTVMVVPSVADDAETAIDPFVASASEMAYEVEAEELSDTLTVYVVVAVKLPYV